MAIVKPFKAIRPREDAAAKVAALPYDVFSRETAKAAVAGHPLSFLNIDRPETQFGPDFDMYSDEAYNTAREMLQAEIADGTFVKDDSDCYYIYELTMDGRAQTGLVACCAIDDYKNSIIKKHENTLAEKELDRIRHIKTTGAQTGPIFLAYRDNESADRIINKIKESKPLYDFTSDDGISHRVWRIDNKETTDALEKIFASIDALYIADGHHRAASACKVDSKDGGFMAVLFPSSQLKIMAYNRAVKDLNGMNKEQFITKLSSICKVSELKSYDESNKQPGTVHMYLDGNWYELAFTDVKKTAEGNSADFDPVKLLDVSLLQDKILEPVLGIKNPREDSRIKFIGGIFGDKELVRLVGDGDYAVAFSMYPTQMNELLSVADAGLLMPPKSTWFEPKLRSGLFIHEI